jgi:hypothetical protein
MTPSVTSSHGASWAAVAQGPEIYIEDIIHSNRVGE